MDENDEKSMLLRYLDRSRDALVWKLEGLDEYDVRRPMTPTGTSLLGLIKHLALVEFDYFGQTFGRPPAESLEGWQDAAVPNSDMFASAHESREEVLGLYARARMHADDTIAALALDTVGHVSWWPTARAAAPLRLILIHMIDETARHAGHADIVRETIDRQAGVSSASSNLPDLDESAWAEHVGRVERAARRAAELARTESS